MDGPVRGGGRLTILSLAMVQHALRHAERVAIARERFEFSSEIDSAMIDDAGLAVLRDKNLNRASIGILDFRR